MPKTNKRSRVLPAPLIAAVCAAGALLMTNPADAQDTAKPVLHGKHWVAVTGKPLAATAGAMTFTRGGNAVDAASAMLAATATMWDVLGWGGETQALIYNPKTGEVKGINALGAAPTGATPEFFRERGMVYPPEYGPLAAVTPGTPGGLMVMLAEYGTPESLAEVLATGHRRWPTGTRSSGLRPTTSNDAAEIPSHSWPDSRRVRSCRNLRRPGSAISAQHRIAGEIFRQLELLRHVCSSWSTPREAGPGQMERTRKEAILRRLRPLLPR